MAEGKDQETRRVHASPARVARALGYESVTKLCAAIKIDRSQLYRALDGSEFAKAQIAKTVGSHLAESLFGAAVPSTEVGS